MTQASARCERANSTIGPTVASSDYLALTAEAQTEPEIKPDAMTADDLGRETMTMVEANGAAHP